MTASMITVMTEASDANMADMQLDTAETSWLDTFSALDPNVWLSC